MMCQIVILLMMVNGQFVSQHSSIVGNAATCKTFEIKRVVVGPLGNPKPNVTKPSVKKKVELAA